MSEETKNFVLPLELASPVDLSRTIKELEALDDFFHQAGIRAPGKSISPPKVGRLLELLAEANGLKLLNKTHRQHLSDELKTLQKKAIKIHISFAVESSQAFRQKILDWFRKNISPYVFMDVGLQPNIAAGCVLRTTNKIFDLSLRNKFDQSKLMAAINPEQSQ